MSTTFTSSARRATPTGSFLRGLGSGLKSWWFAYVTWRLERLAISRLQSMSDRQLDDIGLSRASIEFEVKGGRADRHPMFKRYF